jgi:hypothetical protein
LDAVINEQAGHLDEQYSMNEDVSMNEDENTEDRLPDMVRELFTVGEEGVQNSMFAAVLEEMMQELWKDYVFCFGRIMKKIMCA